MSRSKKNYTSIRAVLEHHDPRVIRLLMLGHQYDKLLNFNPEDSWTEPQVRDLSFVNFFRNSDSFLMEGANCDISHKFGSSEIDMTDYLTTKSNEIHEAILNNFDTPTVILALLALVNKANIYMRQDSTLVKPTVLKSYVVYVRRMLSILGLNYEVSAGGDQQQVNGLVGTIAEFRDSVVTAARQKNFGDVMGACDTLRDETLPPLGVKIEDQGGNKVNYSCNIRLQSGVFVIQKV